MASALAHAGLLRASAAQGSPSPARLGRRTLTASAVGWGAGSESRGEAAVEAAACVSSSSAALSRRTGLLGAAGLLTLLPLRPEAAEAGTGVDVATYLPPGDAPNTFRFVAAGGSTPGIRAGFVAPTYAIDLPAGFSQEQIANIKSGNFCLPRCEEPWTEIVFSGPAGRFQLLVIPTQKLTNARGKSIDQIGPPAAFVNSVGPYIGDDRDAFEEETLVSATSLSRPDGSVWYAYELDNPYGRYSNHSLALLTVRGDVALLAEVSATEAQWKASAAKLRAMVDSFRY